ncbi:MAG: type VI secretion system tube protein Hcp [Hydrogenophaga sp.]|jgi:type VI secretion system secreted protein Hcp|nr:type VI secretion system tube protein Hcp [Hydrogenophaga sp.]
MAETISLRLVANGSDIEGDHTLTSLGREDTIEVLAMEQQLSKAFDRATLRATGRRIYAPIRFTKRLDRSTPLLRQALVNNAVVSGSFRWFRPHPDGDGTTQQFFTLEFAQGSITKCTLRLPDTLLDDSASLPPMEEIELVFGEITWRWTDGGIEFEDTVSRSV